MVDEHDVRRIALLLPHTNEDEGSFNFSVGGTSFAWPYPERVHPKRARVPRIDIFVVRVAGEDDKQAMLGGEPGKVFTTDDRDGVLAVMVRLAEVDSDELTDLLTDGHAAAIRASLQQKRRAKRSTSS